MRLLHAWEDFRSRWSAKDATGEGLTSIDEVISPVVVVGADGFDGSGVNVYGARNVVPAGRNGRTSLYADEPVWLMAALAWDFVNAANVRLFVEAVSATAGVPALHQLHEGPPLPTLLVDEASDIGALPGGVLLSPGLWYEFPSPGLLIGPPGFSRTWPLAARLSFICDGVGEDFSAAVTFRSA